MLCMVDVWCILNTYSIDVCCICFICLVYIKHFISFCLKAPQFVDIHLAEEDSSDEEYHPEDDEEDETAEDVRPDHKHVIHVQCYIL